MPTVSKPYNLGDIIGAFAALDLARQPQSSLGGGHADLRWHRARAGIMCPSMKIAIASDHAAVNLKDELLPLAGGPRA